MLSTYKIKRSIQIHNQMSDKCHIAYLAE